MESSTRCQATSRRPGRDDRRPDRRWRPSGTATAAAVRHKRDGAWHDVSYAELGEIVSEVGRGLIDLGIEPGDRVAILCTPGPSGRTPTSASPPRAPSSCRSTPRTRPRSASGSPATPSRARSSARTRRRWRRSRAVRDDLPALETIIVDRPAGDAGDAIALDELRERGRARDAAELRARRRPSRARTRSRSSTRRARPGRRRAACSRHGNYRDVVTMCERDAIVTGGDVIYLFLPLAHSFALLIQLAAIDIGATIAYFGGDPKQIVAELAEVRPTYLPSVPRIFEKIYTLVTAHGDAEQIAGATQGRPEGARAAGRGRGGAGGAAGALRRGRGEAVQERPRGVRRQPAPGGRAPRRSRRRSSSSSSPAACRCSRATG